MAVLILPIMILNFFAGIVGGVWLAVEGEWSLIGYGLAITVGGAFAASILLLPGIVLAAPAVAATERGNIRIASFFGVLSLLYTYFIMGAWAIFVFIWFAGETKYTIPCLLWSYSTATATWSYLAQKEASSNEYSAISAFFHQIGCIALMIYAYSNFRHLEWSEMAIWYAVPMAAGAIFQFVMMLSNSRQFSQN